jgi:hypothetical protein
MNIPNGSYAIKGILDEFRGSKLSTRLYQGKNTQRIGK